MQSGHEPRRGDVQKRGVTPTHGLNWDDPDPPVSIGGGRVGPRLRRLGHDGNDHRRHSQAKRDGAEHHGAQHITGCYAGLGVTDCLDAEMAAAFLDRSLDPERAAVAEEHVSRCDACRAMLAQFVEIYEGEDSALTTRIASEIAEPSGTIAPVPDRDTPQTVSVGTLVGRYLALGVLGRGGLGIVYSAYDPQLDRKVALKLVRPERRGADAALKLDDRMLREAQAMAKVSHPNVVAIYDVGVHGADVFIAMELIDGRTLNRWAREESPPWTRRRDALVAAGRGLEAAHAAGVVHRDFKLGNVLMGADGRVRVLDFGLARGVAPSADGQRSATIGEAATPANLLGDQLTRVGTVLGTPGYMAPEQLRGETGDARTDQFAFCVAAYKLLYERAPFAGGTVSEILTSIETQGQPAPPPGSRVPAWLHRAITRGLRPQPEERYASMADLLSAITVDKRRRRRWGLAAAFAGAIGVAAVAGWTLRPPQHRPVPSVVEVLTDEANAAAARALFVYPPADEPDAITAYMRVVELESLQGDAREPGRTQATQLRQEFGNTLVRLGDDYWERDGGTPFAADYYAAALLFVPDNQHAASRAIISTSALAVLQEKAERGDFSQGELIAAEPLRILADPDRARKKVRLATLIEKRHVRSTAVEDIERLIGRPESRDLQRPPTAEQPPAAVAKTEPRPAEVDAPPERNATSVEQAEALTRLGNEALAKRRFDAAERSFHQALRHRRSHAPALIGLSDTHFERGAYQQAAVFAKKAVAAAPRNKRYRIKLGDAYLKVLRYDDAEQQYRRAKALGDRRADRRLAGLSRRVGP